MKPIYNVVVAAFVTGALIWPNEVIAQNYTECPTDEDICVVEFWDGENVIHDALRNTIANDGDRPAGRIYMLQRGGLYYNEESIENNGFHLRLEGELEHTGDGPDFGPPVIQMVRRDDGSVNQRMITVQDDMTLKNLWITGQDDDGVTTAYHPLQVEASGISITIDNVIFERSNFAIMGVAGAQTKVYITNSKYRNFINTSQQWEGRVIRFEAGADSLVMENNTFLNIGHTVIQSEAAPIEYVRYVHNTAVNVGRTLNSGAIWKEAFFANNLAVNHFWHGEGEADYTTPGRVVDFAGWFGIAELPPAFGTNLERRIVYANSAHWRDPQFDVFYNDTILAQPMINEITQEFFDTYENMVWQDNVDGQDPGLVSYTTAPDVENFPETSFPLSELVPDQWNTINGLRQGQTSTWATAWLWDPGRNPDVYQGAGFVWPLPEELSYDNSTFLTAGTNGLPLGDLNWFPEHLEDWETNRDNYITQIEDLGGEAPEINIVASVEAEDGVLDGDAEIVEAEGFTSFFMESGGYVEWTFDLEEAGQYDLNVWTHMEGNGTRGQRVFVNGVSIHECYGWGEYIWDSQANPDTDCDNVHMGMPTDEWTWTRIIQDEILEEDALTLNAGENTIRIEPSWGWQSFAGIDILEPGSEDPVLELRAPDAVSSIVHERCEDEDAFCASGFQSVLLGSDGSVSFNVDLAGSGDYLLRMFYEAPSADIQGQILVDGEPVFTSVTFEEDSENVLTEIFGMEEGVRTIQLANADGLNVDYFQVLRIGTVLSSDPNELPEGFVLEQNYPNPFNPSTTINYSLGQSGHVTIDIYNILGQKVRTLVSQEQMAGTYSLVWDGRDAGGNSVASGVYVYRLESQSVRVARKMLLIR